MSDADSAGVGLRKIGPVQVFDLTALHQFGDHHAGTDVLPVELDRLL